MKNLFLCILAAVMILSGCSMQSCTQDNLPSDQNYAEEMVQMDGYVCISQEYAKMMMDEQDVIILDVRRQDEFDNGHIPGAVLLTLDDITEDSAAGVIPSFDSVVLVYCRSGNRSKAASEMLVNLGYTQVYEFGGIITWPYETEK